MAISDKKKDLLFVIGCAIFALIVDSYVLWKLLIFFVGMNTGAE